MKTSLVSLFALGALGCFAVIAPAAEPDATPAASPAASPAHHHRHHAASPSPSPEPSATPVKKDREWIIPSIFKHKPKASPSPSAAASAAPSASPSWHHRHPKPAAEEEPSPTPSPSATPAASQPPAESTSTPEPKKPAELNTQVPFVSGSAAQPEAPIVETKSPVEIEAETTKRFDAAKTQALQDQHVQELQSKADAATGDDAKPALRRYYKALYEKMGDIDPSVKDRIDRTEAATLRRVDQETAQ